ncbi:MAG: glycosyltransferase family 39 protein [Myxococcota bacterium]|nr:glycosyltransferase family 39 protein [Myxococcota bacterium]
MRPALLIPLVLFSVAAILRVHNAWVAAPMSGFDGVYHAAYVGGIYWDGYFQLPHGFTNHPPLYYSLSALVWKLVPDSASSFTALFAMRLLNVFAGLGTGAAIWASARLLFPTRPNIGYSALALTLFVPMLIGPSTVLGNQILSTALGAAAIALLLRCLQQPSPRAALLAGAVAGFGVLTKMSVGIVVAVSGLALLIRGLQLYGAKPRALSLPALFAVAALLASSPHFVRSVTTADVPIDPLQDVWANFDRSPSDGVRPWSAYFDSNIGSILDPASRNPRAQQAVWSNTFGATWFDSHGTVLDTQNPDAKRLGRVLFAFGGFFSVACLIGCVVAALRRANPAVPWGLPALGVLMVVTLASYIAFTRVVPEPGALKGTYLSPGLSGFVLFAALGLDALAGARVRVQQALAVVLVGFVSCVTLLFWQGGIAPMKISPAVWYMRSYADPPTKRVFRYFHKGEPPGELVPLPPRRR